MHKKLLVNTRERHSTKKGQPVNNAGGMPFAISTRRKSKILNIIASLVIAFAFWWLISMVTSMGQNGYLNPYLAGWAPVLIFGSVVWVEFRWMKL